MENLRQNETLKKVSNKEYLENGYIVLKNFLNPGVTKYFNGRTFRYLEHPYHNDYNKGSGHGEHSRSWNTYAHETWEAALERVCPSVQQIIGAPVIPTYSYQRMYMNGSAMAHHSDRPDLLWAAAAEGGLPSSQVGRPPEGRPTTIKEEGITNTREEVTAC